eukprot:s1396_g28.t1
MPNQTERTRLFTGGSTGVLTDTCSNDAPHVDADFGQTFSEMVQSNLETFDTALAAEQENPWADELGNELDLTGLWTPSEVAEYALGDGYASSAYEPESACGDLQSEEQLASAVVAPEFSDVNLDACIQTALSSLPALAPKPIWDEGVWSAIFGNGILMQLDFCNTELHKPPVSECLDSWMGQIDECRRSLKRSLPKDCSENYMGAVRHVTDQSWEEERESQLQMALKRWLVVVISFSNTTLVWRQLAEEQDDVAKMVVLSDLFRGRAPRHVAEACKGPGETVQSLWDWSGRFVGSPHEPDRVRPVAEKSLGPRSCAGPEVGSDQQVIDLTDMKVEVTDSEEEAPSSSSEESAEEFPVKQGRIFVPPQPPEGYVFCQHRKLRTLHLTRPDYTRVFMCNRMIGQLHSKEGMIIRYDTPVCRQCAAAVKA